MRSGLWEKQPCHFVQITCQDTSCNVQAMFSWMPSSAFSWGHLVKLLKNNWRRDGCLTGRRTAALWSRRLWLDMFSLDVCLCNVDGCWNCLTKTNSAKKAAHCRSICWLISWETEMPRPMPESRRDMSKALMPPANAPKTPPKKKNTSWDCAPVQYLTHTEQTIICWVTHLYGLSATDCQPWQASEMTNCNRAP